MKKKIETVSEAAAVLSVKSACRRVRSMHCFRCPLTVYEGGEVPACEIVVREAIDFLMQNIVADDETGKLEPLYKKVCGLGYKGWELPEVIETVQVAMEVPVPNCQGTCSECSRKKLIGGMVFCQAFHNFTHPDGYCYRYEPVDKSSQ